jgi:hypothetical protein
MNKPELTCHLNASLGKWTGIQTETESGARTERESMEPSPARNIFIIAMA